MPGVAVKAPTDLWFCFKNHLVALSTSDSLLESCGFSKGGACLALNQGEHAWRVFPLTLSRSVVRETSFLQFKKATASLDFIRKPTSVVNPMGLFILFLKWDLMRKVYSSSKTCFSGYDDLNVCTFFLYFALHLLYNLVIRWVNVYTWQNVKTRITVNDTPCCNELCWPYVGVRTKTNSSSLIAASQITV